MPEFVTYCDLHYPADEEKPDEWYWGSFCLNGEMSMNCAWLSLPIILGHAIIKNSFSFCKNAMGLVWCC